MASQKLTSRLTARGRSTSVISSFRNPDLYSRTAVPVAISPAPRMMNLRSCSASEPIIVANSGSVFFECFQDGFFRNYSVKGILYLFITYDKNRWYFVDPKTSRNEIIIRINFAYYRSALQIGGDFFKYRIQHSTRKAPFSIEIY